jgi:hypothetical protein
MAAIGFSYGFGHCAKVVEIERPSDEEKRIKLDRWRAIGI